MLPEAIKYPLTRVGTSAIDAIVKKHHTTLDNKNVPAPCPRLPHIKTVSGTLTAEVQKFLLSEERQPQVGKYDWILEKVQSSIKGLETSNPFLKPTTLVGQQHARRQQCRTLFPSEVVFSTWTNSVETRAGTAEPIRQTTTSAYSGPPPAVVASVPSHLQNVNDEDDYLSDSQSETETTVHNNIDGQAPFTSSDSDDANVSPPPRGRLSLPRTRPHAAAAGNGSDDAHPAKSHRVFESTSTGVERVFSDPNTGSTTSSPPPASEGNRFAFPQRDPDLEPFPDFEQCQLAVKEQEVEDLHRELEQVKATAQREKSRLEKETKNVRQALQTMSIQFQEVDSQCQALERENVELRRHVQVLDQHRLDAEGTRRDMAVHIQQLENITRHLEEGNAALRHRNSYLEGVARELQARADLSAASRQMNAALLDQVTSKKDGEVEKLRGQVASLTEQLDQVTEEKWDHFTERNDMEDERDDERTAKEEAQRELGEVREQLRRLREQGREKEQEQGN
ncbi:uncharacterized protein PV06_09601 [Exophiala oligosperma]|uniref:Uncharacterized protein n=1 Tax=Exophiala oligosperma TaxID=215243 RepID=A0A0D2D886_9EURO|nr:uncharacterized protein PV06_09601 [Exophiala oligosperma]KIW38650.1 hypothetical protein PV06_09601 [Exophiala oligosperma]